MQFVIMAVARFVELLAARIELAPQLVLMLAACTACRFPLIHQRTETLARLLPFLGIFQGGSLLDQILLDLARAVKLLAQILPVIPAAVKERLPRISELFPERVVRLLACCARCFPLQHKIIHLFGRLVPFL